MFGTLKQRRPFWKTSQNVTEEMDEGKQEGRMPNLKYRRDFKKSLSNVIYSIKPLIVFEYIYGIYRFYFTKGELRPSNWTMKTYAIMCIVVFLTVFLTFLDFSIFVSGSAKSMEIMDAIPPIVVLIQFTTSTITASFLVNSANIGIFTKLAKIDTILHANAFTDFYKKSRMESYGYLLILCISHIINCVIDLVTAEEITIRGLLDLTLYFVQKLEILTFCKYISMVRSRLIMINDYLKTFAQEQEKRNTTVFTVTNSKQFNNDEKINFIGRPANCNKKIRDLAMMYHVIGKTGSMINEVFNFQIFMTLVSTFTYVLITIWISLYYYRTPGSNVGELINTIVWSFSAIYTIGIMSISCERLLLTRNETRILVNNIIMNYDLPKIMRVQAKAFMELVEAWPLRIYIYDLFSVDITLMLKFISVATTYLIVIIQISHFV